MYSPRGKKGGGATEWYLQRFTAVVLLLAVVFHFLYMHLVTTTNPGDLNFDKVSGRLTNPTWLIFDFILLTGALIHGVIGLKLSLDDYIKNHLIRMKVVSLVYLVMGCLWLLGSIALLKVGLRYNGESSSVSQQEEDPEALNSFNANEKTMGAAQGSDGATNPPPQENPDWYPQQGGGE